MAAGLLTLVMLLSLGPVYGFAVAGVLLVVSGFVQFRRPAGRLLLAWGVVLLLIVGTIYLFFMAGSVESGSVPTPTPQPAPRR